MLDVAVIEDPAAATTGLDPTRSALLSEMAEPVSAATLAARVGLSRQRVNYHLRALESHGLARVVGERKWGGLTERLLVATARTWVVSPSALGEVGAHPGRARDRSSAAYLIALAGRVVREVGDLLRRAQAAGKRLATLSVDTEIRFASAEARTRFTEELRWTVLDLARRYDDEAAPGGRRHRVVLFAHPLPKPPPEGKPSEEKP